MILTIKTLIDSANGESTCFLRRKKKVCALDMNPVMVMNWRLLTSRTLKESSKEKNTLIVLAMMVVTPFNGYDPFCGYDPSGGYAAFNGYERVRRGYEHGYERI